MNIDAKKMELKYTEAESPNNQVYNLLNTSKFYSRPEFFI